MEALQVDMRKPSPAAQEAVALFGISTKSIGRWRARLESGDAEGLRSRKPGRKTGTCRFLTESEEAALKQTILEFTPDDLGLGDLPWTSGKVHAFIKAYFKARFSHGSLIELFGRLGLSFQRPDRRACEANPEVMREWTDVTYLALRARAKDEDAVIMFADQAVARSDHLSGRTPVVARGPGSGSG